MQEKAGTLPEVTITSPPQGSEIIRGTAISFEGFMSNAEEGGFIGSSLVWKMDVGGGMRGTLGTGPCISIKDLSLGNHTIFLVATDSNGATGSASVYVTIIEA